MITGKLSSYPINMDLVNDVYQCIQKYRREHLGDDPSLLELGFGTYFILCESVSDFKYSDFATPPTEYLNQFEGVPIIIRHEEFFCKAWQKVSKPISSLPLELKAEILAAGCTPHKVWKHMPSEMVLSEAKAAYLKHLEYLDRAARIK